MYTIIMDNSKNLVTSVRTKIYQRENLADKIQFLFPQVYEDVNIADCVAILKYENQYNRPMAKVLEKDEELYKEKVRFVLPVDTDITKYAGTIKIRISFLNSESDKNVVLHTGEATIKVEPLLDLNYSDDDLESIDQMIFDSISATASGEVAVVDVGDSSIEQQ